MVLDRLPDDGELQLAAVRLRPGRRIHVGADGAGRRGPAADVLLRIGWPFAWSWKSGPLELAAMLRS